MEMCESCVRDSVDVYIRRGLLTIQPHALERAVQALLEAGEPLEALALVRAAYQEADGGPATLANAKLILAAIGRPVMAFCAL